MYFDNHNYKYYHDDMIIINEKYHNNHDYQIIAQHYASVMCFSKVMKTFSNIAHHYMQGSFRGRDTTVEEGDDIP